MIKIAIDARMVNHSGIGTYTRNLITELKKNPECSLSLIGEPNALANFGLTVTRDDSKIYGLKEQFSIPRSFKKTGAALLHCPHYAAPVFPGGRMVVTVNDLIHLLFPEYLSSPAARIYAETMMRATARRADAVLAISHNTKKDIAERLGVRPEKIFVTPLGVSRIFAPEKGGVPEKKRDENRYILYVGAVRPHKNTAVLIDAFALLKNKHKLPHKLVIAGKIKPGYEKTLRRTLARTRLSRNDAIFKETFSVEELVNLYRGADAFVFPSLYEGFGLPPLEAMASGCPVVASNTSSLPEVVGDAGVLVDPRSPEAIAEAVSKIILDENLAASLKTKGLERAKMYNWEDTARLTFDVYKKVPGA